MPKITDLLALGRDGWRPYGSEPQPQVYERLRCERHLAVRGRPYWLYKGDVFLCLGCEARCSLVRPVGFVMPLPVKYPVPAEPYTLTPLEMVTRKHALNMREVMYCLNISKTTAHRWVAEGKLVALKDKPLRIKAACVRELMENFDE